MKKTTKILLSAAILFSTHNAVAQTLSYPDLHDLPSTNRRNYVRVFVPLQPTQDPADLALTNVDDVKCIVSTKYMDGLGRPMQEVQRTAFQVDNSETQRPDLVKQHTYDAFGRETHQYLPYSYLESGDNKGKLKKYPFTQLSSQYSTLYPDQEPYSEAQYDNSPLNRIAKQEAPGRSWVGAGRGVTFTYAANLLSDNVIDWRIGYMATDKPIYNGYFGDGQLYIVNVTDEDGHMSFEYKDMEGKTVLKRQVVDYTVASTGVVFNYAETYYVYDDLGHLRYVLPPKAIDALGSATSFATGSGGDILEKLCFKYYYDERGRVIEKIVPGKEIEYVIYDTKDRAVLLQDGNLRTDNRWSFTQFDVLDRPLESGIYTPSLVYSREAMQGTIDAGGITAPSLFLYYITNDHFNTYIDPTVTDADVWNQNHYDNYEFYGFTGAEFDASFNSQLTGAAPYAVTPEGTRQTRGLLTCSRIKVLDPGGVMDAAYSISTTPWLKTTSIYDAKERLIQIRKENHCRGQDIVTTQYDFGGNLVSSVFSGSNLLAQGIGSAPAAAFQTTSIVNKFSFDYNTGREKIASQKINGEAFQTIRFTTYDQLGRVKNKNLNVADNLYTYNIRNWLTGINGDKFNVVGASNYYFCEKLLYDDPNDYHLTSSNQPLGLSSGTHLYNGNIAASLWKGYMASPVKAYVYKYDNLNRLTDAKFSARTPGGTHTWSNTALDYSMWGVTYDKNGNILSMNQMGNPVGTSAPPVQMDNMHYAYLDNSNQLKGVKDDGAILPNNPDFKDQPAADPFADYRYDANGNLSKDANKGITEIEYNELNKPIHIEVSDKGSIYYIYDAGGNKLQKIVKDISGSSTVTTTTDYVGAFQYSNNVLKNIAHLEGRCRPLVNTSGSVSYAYDYFIKDHLQNVRTVVAVEPYTGKPDENSGGNPFPDPGTGDDETATGKQRTYTAGHEPDQAPVEDVVFSNIPAVRDFKAASTVSTDQKAAVLLGTDPSRRIGTAKMIRVMPGDQFSVSAQTYYDGETTALGATNEDLLNSLLNTLTGGNIYQGVPLGEIPQSIQLLQNTFYNPSFLGVYNSLTDTMPDSVRPAAYLNYLVLDDEMNIIPCSSAALRVGGNPGVWNELATEQNIRINRPGYVLVFVGSVSTSPVSFDHISLTHYSGRVLEEDHYYPFGLNIEVATIDPALKNNLKFTSKELQDHEFTNAAGNKSGLEWEDYGARMQDPQLGRWMSVDPLASQDVSWSPYNFCFNNPVIFVDLDGRTAGDYLNIKGEKVGTDGNTADGKLYVVNGSDEQLLKQNGGKLPVGDVKSAEELAGPAARAQMAEADKKSQVNERGFVHEESGTIGKDANGNEVVTPAAPGAPVKRYDAEAAEVRKVTSESSYPSNVVVKLGIYHTHPDVDDFYSPDGKLLTVQTMGQYSNVRNIKALQSPSLGQDQDMGTARKDGSTSYSYAISVQDKKVYAYKGDGTIIPIKYSIFFGDKKKK